MRLQPPNQLYVAQNMRPDLTCLIKSSWQRHSGRKATATTKKSTVQKARIVKELLSVNLNLMWPLWHFEPKALGAHTEIKKRQVLDKSLTALTLAPLLAKLLKQKVCSSSHPQTEASAENPICPKGPYPIVRYLDYMDP